MNQLGAMSESERQHVQTRVRAAMDAQVVNEGRHQGGRAPYGYPKNVYLPEQAVLDLLNEWIGRLFAPENRGRDS